MAEKRDFGPRHAIIETYRTLLAQEYGRGVTREEIMLEASHDCLELTGTERLRRPKNFSPEDPVITVDDLKSLPLNEQEFNGTIYVPTERRVIVGTESILLAARDSSIFHPLIAHPQKLFLKDLFIQVMWHYPPEIIRLGRPTFNSGMNRIRHVLRDLNSSVQIMTIPGVGHKLK